jgi:hypothetical protein
VEPNLQFYYSFFYAHITILFDFQQHQKSGFSKKPDFSSLTNDLTLLYFFELFILFSARYPDLSVRAASRSEAGRGGIAGQTDSFDGRRFDNFLVGSTINPVLRCTNWTFLAVNCPRRFQDASLTETCFSVSPLTQPR